MARPASLYQEDVPDPEWLVHTYGIQLRGQLQALGGELAKVTKIHDGRIDRQLVIRISDPARIGGTRLAQVHRFLEYMSEREVRTPIPLRTCEGQTYAVYPELGKLVEVFPYIEGRSPQSGNIEDTRRVAAALARFHNAGVPYEDLPEEESCDINHVGLERLKIGVNRARTTSAGSIFETLLYNYLADAEMLVESLQKLRPGLVQTGLHLDASPDNILLTADGEVWFIDCSHAVRGRRVFDLATAVYYIDRTSRASRGNPQRYEDLDPELESAFLETYRSVCKPGWRNAETEAYALEHQLMLIHGAAYWATEYSESDVMQELIGFQRLRDSL